MVEKSSDHIETQGVKTISMVDIANALVFGQGALSHDFALREPPTEATLRAVVTVSSGPELRPRRPAIPYLG